MVYRICIWGLVFALCGAALWDKHSYDTTGSTALKGGLIGLLLGLLVGVVVDLVLKKIRSRRQGR